MSTIYLTEAQARKLGIAVDTKPVSRNKATIPEPSTTEQDATHLQSQQDASQFSRLMREANAALTWIAPICERYRWQADLARCFTTDQRNDAYRCTDATRATWNAVVILKGVRIEMLGFLWEVKQWCEQQVVERLRTLDGGIG